MAIDSLVDSISTYKQRPIYFHAYVGPFIVLYFAWFYIWLISGINDYWELGCIVMAGIGIIQVSVKKL